MNFWFLLGGGWGGSLCPLDQPMKLKAGRDESRLYRGNSHIYRELFNQSVAEADIELESVRGGSDLSQIHVGITRVKGMVAVDVEPGPDIKGRESCGARSDVGDDSIS